MHRLAPVCLLLTASAWAAPPLTKTGHVAETAELSRHGIQSARFEVHGNINPYVLGAGFRAEIPLAREGIVDGLGNVRDEIALSFGGDVWFASYYQRYDAGAYLVPLCVVEWNFLVRHWKYFRYFFIYNLLDSFNFFRCHFFIVRKIKTKSL